MLRCPCGECPRCPCFAREDCAAYQDWEASHKAQKEKYNKQKAVVWGFVEHNLKTHERIRRRQNR